MARQPQTHPLVQHSFCADYTLQRLSHTNQQRGPQTRSKHYMRTDANLNVNTFNFRQKQQRPMYITCERQFSYCKNIFVPSEILRTALFRSQKSLNGQLCPKYFNILIDSCAAEPLRKKFSWRLFNNYSRRWR